jgi:hypothetical protein
MLVSPLPNWVIVAGYVCGGMVRGPAGRRRGDGGVVLLFTDLHVPPHRRRARGGAADLGDVRARRLHQRVFAKNFDQVNWMPTFVLTPLTYFGGVFYSIVAAAGLGAEGLVREPGAAHGQRVPLRLPRHLRRPGARDFQDLESGGKRLYRHVAERVARDWNAGGNCMLVIGATYPQELAEIRAVVGDLPFLVPGVGAQGGDVAAAVRAGRTADGFGMVLNSSRGIIYASSGEDFAEAARIAARTLRDEINLYRFGNPDKAPTEGSEAR